MALPNEAVGRGQNGAKRCENRGRREHTFAPGNQLAAKRKWTPEEIQGFARQTREFRERICYTHREFDHALGYARTGHYTQKIEQGKRQPSEEFVRRFEALVAANPPPKPEFAAALVYDPDRAAVPLERVLAPIAQCEVCAREAERGERAEAETWWVFALHAQHLCPTHRALFATARAEERKPPAADPLARAGRLWRKALRSQNGSRPSIALARVAKTREDRQALRQLAEISTRALARLSGSRRRKR